MFPEEGRYVTVEIGVCFSKITITLTCKGLFPALQRQTRAHSGTQRFSVVGARDGNHNMAGGTLGREAEDRS